MALVVLERQTVLLGPVLLTLAVVEAVGLTQHRGLMALVVLAAAALVARQEQEPLELSILVAVAVVVLLP